MSGPGDVAPSPTGSRVVLGAVLAVAVVSSCARQGAPPGGPEDLLPPVVVATRPDTFARLESVRDPLRIRFNERISERPTVGTLDDAVQISPQFGEIRVSHSRESLEVDMTGGYRPGLVYRVTVFPVIRDMFNNVMRRPFEFVFSTGGVVEGGVVAGMVIDRITGEPVEATRVHMTASGAGEDEDVPVYVSRTDTSGIYAFRFMPPGRYDLVAFQDRDRDREVDAFEVQGRSSVLLGEADTLIAQVLVLPTDTSRARLAQVEVVDSAALRLLFDDYLDPGQDADRVEVYLDPLEDSLQEIPDPPPAPGVDRVLHAHEYRTWLDSVATADSLEAVVEEGAGGEAGGGGDEAGAGGGAGGAGDAGGAQRLGEARARRPAMRAQAAGPGDDPGTLPDGTPLPTRSLIVLLRGPLPVDVLYRVTVRNATNVNQLTGGGGEAAVVRERPAAAEPEAAGVVADTAGVVADTAGALADTLDAMGDTAGAVADTSNAADTAAAATDTGAVAHRQPPWFPPGPGGTPRP